MWDVLWKVRANRHSPHHEITHNMLHRLNVPNTLCISHKYILQQAVIQDLYK